MGLFSNTADAPNDSFQLYKRLIRTYVLRYQRILGAAAICMIVVAATTGSTAFLVKYVVDDIFVNKSGLHLMLLPLAIIGLGDYGQSLSLRYVGQRVVSDMQLDLFSHLLHADIALFNDQSSGRLISRLTNDIML
ncbi:MAG: hypothetical protein B7X02_01390, partial [Rhodospirillales bacterium 12-54-5]